MLMLVTFSLPGRAGPESLDSLDMIALGKIGTRLMSILVLGVVINRCWGYRARRVVIWCLLPLGCFSVWSVLSTLWSPLPSFSLGQAVSFGLQALLATAIAILWRDLRDTSTWLKTLSWCLFVGSSVMVAVDLMDHDLSGLNRDLSDIDGSIGLLHPTTAGAMASLGIAILVPARMLWGWRWTRLLLWPSLVPHGLVLIWAASRMAIVAAAASLALTVLCCSRRGLAAVGLFFFGLAGVTYLMADRQMELVSAVHDVTTAYLQRGESAEQMQSLTGRTALWDAILESVVHAPVIGNGYFVTSRTGTLDVWGRERNESAHNLLLQVLVSTGGVGVVLFVWGIGRPSIVVWRLFRADAESRAWVLFLGILAVWYLLWCQLSSGFVGPIQPESIVFFVLLGIAVGSAKHVLGRADCSRLDDPR